MQDEEQKERGFTIVDKRDQGEDPERAPAKPGASGASGASSSAATSAAREAEAPPLPPADFSSLAITLASSALYHLGLAPGPQGGAPGEKNLPVARHTIDTLEMLQQKTAGNLDEEEQKLLAHLLTELRMQFVEAKRN